MVHMVNLQAQCCSTDVAVLAKCFLVTEVQYFAEFCFHSKKCCTCAKIVFSVDFFVPDSVMMLTMTILF
jgi:hypothetical protein